MKQATIISACIMCMAASALPALALTTFSEGDYFIITNPPSAISQPSPGIPEITGRMLKIHEVAIENLDWLLWLMFISFISVMLLIMARRKRKEARKAKHEAEEEPEEADGDDEEEGQMDEDELLSLFTASEEHEAKRKEVPKDRHL